MLDVGGRLASLEGEVSRDARNGRPIAVRHIERIATHEECDDDDAYKRSRGALVPLPDAELPEDVIRRLLDAQ